ncbi:MAG: hypothetical protein HYU67_00590 [Flavobacteriia bacterium]|nr:hypothetical protein [Flavobacteriia bacterium]
MNDYWQSLSRWKKIKLIFSIIVAIYIIIFTLINWDITVVNFVFFKIEIPIILLIVICLIAGYFSSTLFDYRKHRKLLKEIDLLKTKLSQKD